MAEISAKIASATKWSSITELIAKLIAPITSMVLARILTPEAFGVLVTATMVISFAEIFAEAGFQKYIIQHDFQNKEDLYKSATVAFWSNLGLSIIIFLILVISSSWIAKIVGNEGYGNVIAVSSICIPLIAFSSIQMALYRRELEFKTLFWVRIIGCLIPIIITIPLAIFLRTYWALIIGMIGLNLSNAIILTIKAQWRPKLSYSISIFKQMFSFSFWSMMETLSVWLTCYCDIFIVGRMLDDYYLGIYKTSMTTVEQIISLITAATVPVLFASLSRLQSDNTKFVNTFLKFQKTAAIIIFPICSLIFIFRDFIVEILLGNQWHSAAHMVGTWGLSSSVVILFCRYASEVYRAKGRPKLSTFSQIFAIAVIIPAVYFGCLASFEALCNYRVYARLIQFVFNVFLLQYILQISVIKMFKNIMPTIICAACMFVILLLPNTSSPFINILYIILTLFIYIILILRFKSEHNIILNIISRYNK